MIFAGNAAVDTIVWACQALRGRLKHLPEDLPDLDREWDYVAAGQAAASVAGRILGGL